jgi:mono/diheme cytochrome c family protein
LLFKTTCLILNLFTIIILNRGVSMKTFLKIIGILAVLFIIVVVGGIIYISNALPDVGPAPDLSVESTPEMVARGKYIARHVSACIDCHSERNWKKFAGPIKAGTYGKGGELFPEDMGLPGNLVAPNITPHNLGGWSDGEIYKVITTGVTKDNRALFPLMPYKSYAHMAHEDILSVIAYLRTLEPIDNDPAATELYFPMSLIVNTIPEPVERVSAPDTSNLLEYGKYMTTIAGCADCHTPAERGVPIEGMDFAGGFEFPLPNGTVVRSANITPDSDTGIGDWDEELFVEMFKSFDDPEDASDVGRGEFTSVMPWYEYSGMTEKDLSAIFAYLRTQKPVSNSVTKFTP